MHGQHTPRWQARRIWCSAPQLPAGLANREFRGCTTCKVTAVTRYNKGARISSTSPDLFPIDALRIQWANSLLSLAACLLLPVHCLHVYIPLSQENHLNRFVLLCTAVCQQARRCRYLIDVSRTSCITSQVSYSTTYSLSWVTTAHKHKSHSVPAMAHQLMLCSLPTDVLHAIVRLSCSDMHSTDADAAAAAQDTATALRLTCRTLRAAVNATVAQPDIRASSSADLAQAAAHFPGSAHAPGLPYSDSEFSCGVTKAPSRRCTCYHPQVCKRYICEFQPAQPRLESCTSTCRP
jgi:hypothetical protein